MNAVGASRGAITIVNAIATGRGSAMGISLETDAEVTLRQHPTGLKYRGPTEGTVLIKECVTEAEKLTGKSLEGCEIRTASEIPVSRGLKSSSAASNAVVLALTKAAGFEATDQQILLAAVEASLRAGVTITGAYDDACACYYGGVVMTDNRKRQLIKRAELGSDIVVMLHIPNRKISKRDLRNVDFAPAARKADEAFRLALEGSYLKALELNSSAYAPVLDVSEDAAELARKKGALAAGITGTGPATAILVERSKSEAVRVALTDLGGEIIITSINMIKAKEVVPRLL